MALRIFGWCLVVVGVGLALLAFRMLSDTSDMGRLMAEAGDALGRAIDARQWSWRWRVNGIGVAILAVGGVLSGLSFVARHRQGWAVLSATLAANVAWLLAGRGLGPREYAFEATATRMAAMATLAVLCGWAAWRASRRAAR
jgi:hypothetical protein